jgi:hypothetical protein
MQAWSQGLVQLSSTDAGPWLASFRTLVEHCVQSLAESNLLPLHAARAVNVLCQAATCARALGTPPGMKVSSCARALGASPGMKISGCGCFKSV